MTPESHGEPPIAPFAIEEIFPEDVSRGPGGADDVRLPRRQVGSAQELAVTLVADYTLLRRGWIPSAALVTLLNAFGITDAAARTVISRLGRRGLLEGRRDGRRSLYRLPDPVARHLADAGRWIGGFAGHSEPWDGTWTVVAYSLPKDETLQRRQLREQLRWHGFAPLYDGMWVSPRPPDARIERELRAAGGATTLFRARHVDLGSATGREPLAAWDLGLVAGLYAEFLDRWTPLQAQVEREEITGAAAVRARTEVMDGYRRFPLLDPRLPDELLPADWPRPRTRQVFLAVYDGLAGPAESHVRDVSATTGADLEGIAAHTVEQMATGLGYPTENTADANS